MNKLLTLMILAVLAACGTKTEKAATTENIATDQSDMRLKQYMVEGQKIYQTYCLACHQSEGQGLAQLYPPLAGADYLLEDLPRAACTIKNGKTGEITVNGVTYNQMMPANALTPLQIAEVLTYITNSWGNNKGLSNVTEVEKWLGKCE